MKKRTLIALIMMTVITVLCFTACGKKEAMTLEKYCKDKPEVQESISKAMSDSNVLVEIKGNDIIYTSDLASMEGYTEEIAKNDAVKKALGDALTAAGATFGNISKNIEESSKIEGINTIVNYTWGEEVLVTKTFTSADAETAEEPAEDAADAAEDAAEEAAEEVEAAPEG